MKSSIIILLVAIFLSCSNKKPKSDLNASINIKTSNQLTIKNNDTISDIVTKKVFNELSLMRKNIDSFSLFDNYTFKIEKKYNPIYLSFKKCTPFINKQKFDENFTLLDITEWNEEALIHKHYFYKKENYIFIIDTFNDTNLSVKNRCIVENNETIQRIRIYTKTDYLLSSKESISSNFGKKIK